MKKRVGLLIPSLADGGAERVVSRLSFILGDKYDIYLILFDSSNPKYQYNGEIINIAVPANTGSVFSKIILLFKRTYRLKKVKKQYKIDVLISFLDSPNIVNVLSKVNSCKTIISIRNYFDIEKKSSFFLEIMSFLTKNIYSNADAIISVSKEIKDNLIYKYGVEADKVKVIYNPYDVEEIQERSKEKIEEKHLDFMNSNKIFISVGRQMYQKGFWHLIKSFKQVHDVVPESKLVIIGRDSDNENINNLVKKLELEKDVLFTGYQENPFKFINKSHVYVMTSLFEGFPNALVEAMACGCPIISTDCKSGPKEILLDDYNSSQKINDIVYGDYGVLVPAFRQGENWNYLDFEYEDKVLAKAMINIIRNEQEQKKYSEKSIYRAKVFSYEKCLNEYSFVIENC